MWDTASAGKWHCGDNDHSSIDHTTSDNNRNHCNSRGWITRDAFLPHMQRTTLKVRMSTGKVLSDSAQVLSCA